MNTLVYALWIIELNRRNHAIFVPEWGWLTPAEFSRINRMMVEDARDLEESRKPY